MEAVDEDPELADQRSGLAPLLSVLVAVDEDEYVPRSSSISGMQAV